MTSTYRTALLTSLMVTTLSCSRPTNDVATPIAVRLVDLFDAKRVQGSVKPATAVRPTIWRFDGAPPSPPPATFAATRGWEAGPGIVGLTVADGRLTGDRPVVIKAQFVYQLPWNVLASANFQSQSGRPIYEEVRPPASLTRIPGTTRVIANPPDGELRTAHWNQLDMRAEKSFALGGSTELAVFGDFLNLFNTDANESVLDRRIGNSNYLVPSRFVLPRRLMLGGKFRF